MRLPVLFALFAALLAPAPAARADDVRAYDVEIVQPWARASAPGVPVAVVFLRLNNDGDLPERLLRASSPLAERIELRRHVIEGSDIRPQRVGAIGIPPHETVELIPGGLHLALFGLREPLLPGQRFPMTLSFERAGSAEVTVEVTDAAAMGPGIE
jgi:copper(I)-binding protein